ncbi:DUF222 domain-containing protein, partial [Actinoplanes italicus]|uniref:DUF222 domain-containing protein n=1 Tax=Actinoplanes italicus TaxID=113567 RepID=UPI001940BE33
MPEVMGELADLAAQAAARWLAPLSQGELLDFLDTVHSAQQMLHAALLHAVREADRRGVPAAQHAPSPQSWLRGRLRVSPAAAHHLLTQATAIDRDPALDAAVTAGKVNAEQLGTIVAALAELPAAVDPETRARAGAVLTDWARHLDPGGLRIAGRRVLSHVAPEVADAEEERWLRRMERDAHADRYLTLSPAGGGRVRLRGMLDTESAAVVNAALDPLCKPDPAEPGQLNGAPSRTGAKRTLHCAQLTPIGPEVVQAGEGLGQIGSVLAQAGPGLAQAGLEFGQAGPGSSRAQPGSIQDGTRAAQAGPAPAQAGSAPAQAGSAFAQTGSEFAQEGHELAQPDPVRA